MRKEYGYGRATAIRTVEHCIERNILREHLIEKRSEVVNMLDDLFTVEELQMIYDLGMKRKMREGIKETVQTQVAEAQAQARSEVLAQARAQTRTQAVTMLRDGLPPEKVVLYTKLPADYVEELSHELSALA